MLTLSALRNDRIALIRSDSLFVDESWFRAKYPAYGGGAYRQELDTVAPPP